MMWRLKLFAGIVAGLCCLAAAAIVASGLADHVATADVIVVPGNTVAADGTPSPRLRARLDAALRLFEERRAPLIFVSGGTGREGYDEALSMASYLTKRGAPQSAIVMDNLGVDTAATAANASRFMRTNNLKTAIVATQYFHVARTRLALERNGIQVVGTVHAQYVEVRDLYSIPREVIAYAVYSLRGVSSR